MTSHERNLLKTEAEIMRYCGFKCRADYQRKTLVVTGASADEINGFRKLHADGKSGINSKITFKA